MARHHDWVCSSARATLSSHIYCCRSNNRAVRHTASVATFAVVDASIELAKDLDQQISKVAANKAKTLQANLDTLRGQMNILMEKFALSSFRVNSCSHNILSRRQCGDSSISRLGTAGSGRYDSLLRAVDVDLPRVVP